MTVYIFHEACACIVRRLFIHSTYSLNQWNGIYIEVCSVGGTESNIQLFIYFVYTHCSCTND